MKVSRSVSNRRSHGLFFSFERFSHPKCCMDHPEHDHGTIISFLSVVLQWGGLNRSQMVFGCGSVLQQSVWVASMWVITTLVSTLHSPTHLQVSSFSLHMFTHVSAVKAQLWSSCRLVERVRLNRTRKSKASFPMDPSCVVYVLLPAGSCVCSGTFWQLKPIPFPLFKTHK